MSQKAKIIEWMLDNSGIAVAEKTQEEGYMNIIKQSNNTAEYKELEKFAKNNGLYIVYGRKEKGNKLGYLRC